MSSTTKTTSSPSSLDALARWARLKKYRIEVTYGVYVYTPMEKVVFWSIFCLLFTILPFAAALYIRRSVPILVRQASVYVNARDVLSNLFPRKDVALPMHGSARSTSLMEVISNAANSQIP
ncbi:hypothetical protein GGS23DRAFT_599170 [Durotheca rogersii]|uniref:uncharacterized protein n=1 Tax=Durotheca rogersii TaxID=419775 RepID=UPI00221F308E|nr:uncharacterized protein GGS23DRAFT_599170 [Durotheca rogersii]KAI5860649.1 hypothetical protein GGS23DRAFT_599170 [Durotheca rogersii]